MHLKIAVRSHTKLTLQLLGACLYCAAVMVQAAEPSSSNQWGSAKSREQHAAGADDLQLHLTQFPAKPRSQQVASIGSLKLAWNDDDCEEDSYVSPTQDSPMHVEPDAASQPRNQSLNGMQLAKLDPLGKSSDSQTRDSGSKEMLLAASKQKVESASLPTKSIPVPTSVPTPTNAAQSISSWEIIPGDKTLNTSLARWAAAAGWQLVWELPVDYAVEARTMVPGTFEEAVEVVAKSMETAEIPMKAIFYKGNKVLRIVAKGSE